MKYEMLSTRDQFIYRTLNQIGLYYHKHRRKFLFMHRALSLMLDNRPNLYFSPHHSSMTKLLDDIIFSLNEAHPVIRATASTHLSDAKTILLAENSELLHSILGEPIDKPLPKKYPTYKFLLKLETYIRMNIY